MIVYIKSAHLTQQVTATQDGCVGFKQLHVKHFEAEIRKYC